MWHLRITPTGLRLLAVSVLFASVRCTAVAAADGPKVSDGTEPWIVMFKKGVDGKQLWDKLCPSISIGDDPAAKPGIMLNTIGNSMDAGNQLLLNCTAHFSSLLNGFAGYFTLKQLDTIKAQYKTSLDYAISDKAVQIDTPKGMLEATARTTRRLLAVEDDATWGLDIIDQGFLPLDNKYHYDCNGTGVNVYVLDTGIRTHHEEFRVPGTNSYRAVSGFDAVSSTGPGTTEDCHGHGSHVAAVIGGNTFGVAKNVTLHAVRVLDCQGKALLSSLIQGLEWVAKNHIKPAVVHMSVEGGFSSLVNQAIAQLMKSQHVHVVVSAGNSGQDACRTSPASTPGAVTVGAIDQQMQRWAYSNWGTCVDIFAPGVSILSAVAANDNSTALKTGTSMAAPFVTGVVAAYLESHPGASPEEVQEKLYQSAVRGAIADDPQGFATMFPGEKPMLLDISSTPNRMLLSNITSQARVFPGVIQITSNTSSADAAVTLAERPSSPVTVQVTVPNAWDGNPIADIYPETLTFSPDAWNVSQTVALFTKPACEGDYYLSLSLSGADSIYPAMHTVLVEDNRKKSGDSAGMARVITRLPFNDTGDSSTYTDNYGCQVTDASPDVTYRFTAPTDMDVIVSTCGSAYDTKLIVSMNLDDPASYLCNDDDRGCASNTACSRLDVSFRANHTYFIVVDGYGGASGEYVLSLTCPKCVDTTLGNPNGLTAPLIAALMQISLNSQTTNGRTGIGGSTSDDSSSSDGTVTPVMTQFQQASVLNVDPAALMNIPGNTNISAQALNPVRRTMTAGLGAAQPSPKGGVSQPPDTRVVFKATEALGNNGNSSTVSTSQGVVPGDLQPNLGMNTSRSSAFTNPMVRGMSTADTAASKLSAGTRSSQQDAFEPGLSCVMSNKGGTGSCSFEQSQETKKQSKNTADTSDGSDIVFLEVPESKLGQGTASAGNSEKAKM